MPESQGRTSAHLDPRNPEIIRESELDISVTVDTCFDTLACSRSPFFCLSLCLSYRLRATGAGQLLIMLHYRTQGYNGCAVKYSPFFDNRLAVASSSNFGLVGNGRLHILELTANGIQPLKW